ncbi:MAG TPA: SpoIIE family protein phosphatase [Candidatus Brocadiia bacterium]|mgnify:CR=1 FL=1|nr:SpoIIE family protein phosphatase [Candidatus Brocadiia bacterium]
MSDPTGPTRDERRPGESLGLADLVDVALMQQIQDWFGQTAGVYVVIRDVTGEPVTLPYVANGFCRAVASTPAGASLCKASHREALRQDLAAGEAAKYVCHAGLTQVAAPITVAGQRLGMIIMGDRVEGEVDPKRVRSIAAQAGLDAAALAEASRAIQPWVEEEMRRALTFLQAIATAIARLCYQTYQMRKRVRELSRLYDISRMLASTLDQSRILDLIAKTAADMLGVKGCSIRLLDKRTNELVIKSWYNMSRRYRNKGPVKAENSPIDRAALAGELVEIEDMQHDPRVLYPAEAAAEGFVSGVVVGLISKGNPIGALHVYSSERRSLDDREKQFLRSLAAMAAVAIENAQLYADSLELQAMDRELEMAAQIQRRLLPAKPPEPPGWQISAYAAPCQQVGGDFYDFIRLAPNRYAVTIADVVGKGVPGAILMATTRAMLRSRASADVAPAEVMRRLNVLLCRDINPDQFVTLFYADIDMATGRVDYCNAGHCFPLLYSAGGVTELDKGGLVLGADANEVYDQGRVTIEPGGVLLLYTDGITEAESRRGRYFGRERLDRAVLRRLDGAAGGILRGVRDALRGFALGAPQSDDYTAIVIKRDAAAGK